MQPTRICLFMSTNNPASPRTQDLSIYLGHAPRHHDAEPVSGGFVERDGEAYYQIVHYDRMRPFFMSIASDSDHWLFISSTGALTAGRKSPEHALFPYDTVDKIHDAQDKVGGKTLCLVHRDGRRYLWEPFSDRYGGVYATRRTLYKSVYGNKVCFEETNLDLQLTLSCTWCTSSRFGFVKRMLLHNEGDETTRVEVLDGLQHLLAYGVTRRMQMERSVLLDAYKKNERLVGRSLALITLSAQPVDRAEPSEALMATTVWTAGLDADTYLLSREQLDRFRAGMPLTDETITRGQRAAYFAKTVLTLDAGASHRWEMVADINQDATDVVALSERLTAPSTLREALVRDIEKGTERLRQLVGHADGLQTTADRLTTTRHFANALFNIMRGGVFDNHHQIERDDLLAFVRGANAPLANAHADQLQALPARITIDQLWESMATMDPQVERLCLTYLPLTFSRRHGDPSRPWNAFSIDLTNPDGTPKRHYQGNWRDIFQNWEALGVSYPGFLESMVATFVNASTADGYNPYRITRDGIDWEVIEPDDPWSYIGYWGDHQIIYLLKLLEQSNAFHPGRLAQLLHRRLFAYANVPYRIKPYADLCRDPRDTIRFDEALDGQLRARKAAIGSDGVLLTGADGEVLRVTLMEKLLVPMLAKLTNLVPEGGIWMNTQRPEWNDANNALVGYGLSMVTVYYLRRYLTFLERLLDATTTDTFTLSTEVNSWLGAVNNVMNQTRPLLEKPLTDTSRKTILDALGEAGDVYREQLYAAGLSGEQETVSGSTLRTLVTQARAFADHAIQANQRTDGLYHAYNLLVPATQNDKVGIQPMYLMLEGQVAALSAGVLTPQEALEVLQALRESALYRGDQHSYLLYPHRLLPGFLEKNNVPPSAVRQSPLLQQLLSAQDPHLVVQDQHGGVHFNGTFRNKTDVARALDFLRQHGYATEVAEEHEAILDLFESVFDHRSYTGRSGTFFGYEGLGCIYWHMVSKLVLAVQEIVFQAHDAREEAVTKQLAACYYDLREGLGLYKSPDVYGALPTDPYSHTPSHAGARQPGMTGQVKEDILCRWGELGLRIRAGQLHIDPVLLRDAEFLTASSSFRYHDLQGDTPTILLEPGSLAFTFNNVPVVYHQSPEPQIQVHYRNGAIKTINGEVLPKAESQTLFRRSGEIERLVVQLMPSL